MSREFEYQARAEEGPSYWWPEMGKVIRTTKLPYDFSIDERQPEVFTRQILIEKSPAHWKMPIHVSYNDSDNKEPVDIAETDVLSYGC